MIEWNHFEFSFRFYAIFSFQMILFDLRIFISNRRQTHISHIDEHGKFSVGVTAWHSKNGHCVYDTPTLDHTHTHFPPNSRKFKEWNRHSVRFPLQLHVMPVCTWTRTLQTLLWLRSFIFRWIFGRVCVIHHLIATKFVNAGMSQLHSFQLCWQAALQREQHTPTTSEKNQW